MPQEKAEGKVAAEKVSRRDMIKRKKGLSEFDHLEMPPCDAQYLVAYLYEVGPTMVSSMGESPVLHTEIDAWQRNTGIELSAWESRIIRSLSIEYLGEMSRATDRDCPAPWQGASYSLSASQIAAERMKRETRALAQL